METENIVTTLVKEYTTEKARNMAICCLSMRISMRGGGYLFEKKDANKNYITMASFKDKHAVMILILEKVESTLKYPSNKCIMDLTDKESETFASQTLFKGDEPRTNMEKIDKYLKILDSELLIKL